MGAAKKYELTPEHRAQLEPWRDKWIANAMSTSAMTDEERSRARAAIRGLYEAASLKPPPDHRIVFVPSPFVLRFAAGFAAWIWYLRKQGGDQAATEAATGDATRAATGAATEAATEAATRAATEAATRDAAMAATEAATGDATRAATGAATEAATEAATWAATGAATGDAAMAATWAATGAATWDATLDATEAATGAATEAATEAATRAATEAATRDAAMAATEAATGDATWAATGAATWDATRDATEAATGAATEAATEAATRAATRAATEAATMAATEAATGDATWAATGAATWDATEAATWAATRDATRDATRAGQNWYTDLASVMRAVARAIGGPHAKAMLECAGKASSMWNGGNQWSAYAAYLSFFRHVPTLPLDYSKWDHYETLALVSGPRVLHAEFAMISDRPETLLVNESNQPHCATGPFCRWRDGTELYAVDGIRVPAWVVTHPERITVSAIEGQENAEIKRVMIDRYGVSRYVRDAQFETVATDTDRDGQPRRILRRGTLHLVEAFNSTVDGDGSRRLYHMPFHPEVRPIAPITFDAQGRATGRREGLGEPQTMTCHNAIASTYGLRGEQYHPMVET